MSGVRRLYLDTSPGERRGLVTLDGEPERLFIERDGQPLALEPGARARARVRRVDVGLGLAFLDLGDAEEAVLPFAGKARPVEGALLLVEVSAPARRGKAAVIRVLGAGEGAPGLETRPPSLEERLRQAAPGAAMVTGADAREAADLAEEAVLADEHRLAGGASIAVEATRALVAVDVDLGAALAGDPRRNASRINRLALAEAARILRLKGLGGLVVVDLAGKGHDGAALSAVAKIAFEPDNPGVSIGPISRFGTLELAVPWRRRPLAETLCAADGRLSALSVALRLAREIEREGRADPGARLTAVASPEVAAAFRPLLAALGPRYDVRQALGADRQITDIQRHG